MTLILEPEVLASLADFDEMDPWQPPRFDTKAELDDYECNKYQGPQELNFDD